MTSRERVQKALDFKQPDRIPVFYNPSPAGLYTHGQKLLDLFNAYPPDNAVTFDTLPVPPAGSVLQNEYHEFKTDEWGTTWEYRLFGIAGHAVKFPLADWAGAAAYTLPAVPKVSGPDFMLKKETFARTRQTHITLEGWLSLQEKLFALRPTEETLCDLLTEEPALMAFMDRLTQYWLEWVPYYSALGLDAVYFADDWGTQGGQLISTELFRALFKERYKTLVDAFHKARIRVFFHSCGKLDGLFSELLDLGIDCIWPQIALYDMARFTSACKERGVCTYLHADRQKLVPFGTPAQIDAYIRKLADTYKTLGGGAIFWVEIENDAPFENVKALIESIDRYR